MELVVTMAIMMVVGTIMFLVVVQTTTVVGRARNQTYAANSAQVAMRTMTEDIRSGSTLTFTSSVTGACPTTPTAANCLTFSVVRDTSSYASCTNTVTYGLLPDTDPLSLTGWKIMRTSTPSSCPGGGSTVSRRLLANVGSGTLFSYYDGGGNLLSSGQGAAKSVGVSFAVTYLNGATPVSLNSFAALRNSR